MKTIIYQQDSLLLKEPRILLQFSENIGAAESEKYVEDIRALLHHALSEHLKKSEQLNRSAQPHEAEALNKTDRSPEAERLNKEEYI